MHVCQTTIVAILSVDIPDATRKLRDKPDAKCAAGLSRQTPIDHPCYQKAWVCLVVAPWVEWLDDYRQAGQADRCPGQVAVAAVADWFAASAAAGSPPGGVAVLAGYWLGAVDAAWGDSRVAAAWRVAGVAPALAAGLVPAVAG